MTNTDTPGEGLARYRHKKRGSEYALLGIGKMQAKGWYDPSKTISTATVDMREVAIYRSIDDGSLWVRPREEFEDGRFEAIPSPSVIGSDTAGLPSDCEGLAADDSVAKVWDILVAGGWRPPVVPSSAISEAIAALSRASDEQRDPEHGGTWYDDGKGYAADPPSRAPGAVAWRIRSYFAGHPLYWQLTSEKWLADRRRDEGDEVEPLYATPPAPRPPVNGDVVALAEKYCEGWCKENGGQGKFDDCTGCEIAALSASPPQGEPT